MTQETSDVNPEVQPTTTEEQTVPSAQGEDALRQKLQEIEAKFTQLEKEGKGHQQAAFKASREAQDLRDRLAERESDREILKVVIAELASRKGVTEEQAEADIQRNKPDLLAKFNQIEQQQVMKRARDKGESYRKIVEGELSLKPTDEEYAVIQALVVAGKYDLADRRIESLKAKTEAPKKETKVEKPKLTEAEEEEIARKYMVSKGLLKQETGSPSASGTFTREQIKNMPLAEFEKLKPEIDKARKEGKIK